MANKVIVRRMNTFFHVARARGMCDPAIFDALQQRMVSWLRQEGFEVVEEFGTNTPPGEGDRVA